MTIYLGTQSGLLTLGGERVVNGAIGAIARDGDCDAVWSVVNDRELFRDRERVAIAPEDIKSLAARDGAVLAGTKSARLWHLDVRTGAATFVAGFDALDRHRWGTPWGGPPEVITCAILDDGAWLAGVHVGGVWRSDDAGRTWREVVDLGRDDHQVVARGSDIVIACGGGPIGLSRDGGRTFTFPREGLPHSYGTAIALGDAVVLACSSGPFAKESVLVRAELGSTSFTRVHEARANVHALSALGATVVCADDEGRVAVSRDAGRTWTDEGARAALGVIVM